MAPSVGGAYNTSFTFGAPVAKAQILPPPEIRVQSFDLDENTLAAAVLSGVDDGLFLPLGH